MVSAIEFIRSDYMKKTRRPADRFCVVAMCVLVPLLTGGCTELRNSLVDTVEAAARTAVETAVQGFFDQFRSDG
jgi:hypothetical protein